MGIIVSAKEAADLCGVSERTVRRWIETDRLPVKGSGGPRRRRGADKDQHKAAVGPSTYQIDTDDIRAAGFPIDPEELQKITDRRATPARVRELEAENAELLAKIAQLEAQIRDFSTPFTPVTLSEGQDAGERWRDVQSISTTPYKPRARQRSAIFSPTDTFPTDWLTVQDVSKQYGLNDRTLRDAILAGHIPAHKGEWKRGAHKPQIGIDPQQLDYILSKYPPRAPRQAEPVEDGSDGS